jgi:hypothetical protein
MNENAIGNEVVDVGPQVERKLGLGLFETVISEDYGTEVDPICAAPPALRRIISQRSGVSAEPRQNAATREAVVKKNLFERGAVNGAAR